jgi:hypothetical protein
MKQQVMMYGVPLRVSVDSIADIWERALEDTRATFANLGVSPSSLGAPLGTLFGPVFSSRSSFFVQYRLNVRLNRPAMPSAAGAVSGMIRDTP